MRVRLGPNCRYQSPRITATSANNNTKGSKDFLPFRFRLRLALCSSFVSFLSSKIILL